MSFLPMVIGQINIDNDNEFDDIDKQYDSDNLSAKDCAEILENIDRQLEPENLTEGGDVSGANLRQKKAILMGAKKDLIEMARKQLWS